MVTKKKSSLKDRLRKKKKELKDRSSKNQKLIFQKEGTIRVRLMNTGDDNDFIAEVLHFYLGPTLKGVISPETISEPCAVLEKYHELKESDNPDDKDLAKSFSPKKRYLAPVIVYTDLKGTKVDKDNTGKLVQLSVGQYEKLIDLYLDEDEWGDMTDPENGYDVKLIRSGTGQFDTEYDVQPCKNSPVPAEFKDKVVDLDGMVRAVVPTYEETTELINSFLSGDVDDEEEEEKPKKKSLKKKKK